MCCLYKHIDAKGEVLYVGISNEAWRRSVQHEGRSAWFSQVVRIDVEHFKSRSEAIAAEEEMVMRIKPRFNVDYLLDRTRSVTERRRAIVGKDLAWVRPLLKLEIEEKGFLSVQKSTGLYKVTLLRFLKDETVPHETTVAALVAHFKGGSK